MPHALRRVPCPFEVDVLQTEVGRDQGFMPARKGDHRTVVPNADSATEPNATAFRPEANAADQCFLRQRHGAINIQG